LRFWEESTSAHFREEEEVLLAVYARHGGELGVVPIQEMVVDHARIWGLVMTLIEEDRLGEVGTVTLREIGSASRPTSGSKNGTCSRSWRPLFLKWA
jgi:hypothetical protein